MGECLPPLLLVMECGENMRRLVAPAPWAQVNGQRRALAGSRTARALARATASTSSVELVPERRASMSSVRTLYSIACPPPLADLSESLCRRAIDRSHRPLTAICSF
jgi:hypothetical protein